jgi:transposase
MTSHSPQSQRDRTRRKDRHLQTSTSYGTTSRREAVELVLAGRSVKDVADSLGCSDQSLHAWVKRYQLDHRERDDGITSAEREELRQLRKRVKRLEQERDILKRAAVLFAAETETR